MAREHWHNTIQYMYVLIFTSFYNKVRRDIAYFKGFPGCFFTRTSLLKSSNNLEPMCKNVNIKSSWLVIFRIISVTSSFTVWGKNTTNGPEPKKREISNFSNTLVFNDL